MQVNLVFIKKDGSTQTFALPSAVTFIGRRQDCDMCIPLSIVSRRHCELFTEYGKLFVRDLRSKNGTYVNKEPVEQVQLKPGDELTIGPVKFIIQIDGAPEIPDQTEPQLVESAQASRPPSAPDESEGADIEDISEDLNQLAGQSQTMDIDNIFSNDLFDDEFSDGSDLLNS